MGAKLYTACWLAAHMDSKKRSKLTSGSARLAVGRHRVAHNCVTHNEATGNAMHSMVSTDSGRTC